MPLVLSGDGAVGPLSATEVGYLDGVTSAVQTQINTKAAKVGSVLQVVSASSTTATAVTSTTMTDTTLSASITPSASSSKILVIVNQSLQLSNSASMGGAIRVVRDSTVISSDDTYQTIYNSGFAGAFTLAARAAFTILDSPNTTSAVTYKTQVRRETTSGTITVQYGSSQSTITLLEIGA